MILGSNKIRFLFSIGILFLFFVCPLIYADGLVPCEGPECTINDFLILIKNIINFVTTNIVPPLAVLLIVWGGIMLMTAQGDLGDPDKGNPGKVKAAKQVLTAVFMGLIIIYLAKYLILGLISAIGGQGWVTEIIQ